MRWRLFHLAPPKEFGFTSWVPRGICHKNDSPTPSCSDIKLYHRHVVFISLLLLAASQPQFQWGRRCERHYFVIVGCLITKVWWGSLGRGINNWVVFFPFPLLLCFSLVLQCHIVNGVKGQCNIQVLLWCFSGGQETSLRYLCTILRFSLRFQEKAYFLGCVQGKVCVMHDELTAGPASVCVNGICVCAGS